MDDLTVVLTLKDRAEFTYRWMRWMDEQKFPYRILIADGGSDQVVEQHLRDYSNYPSLRYEYIRYPYDDCIRMFIAKVADVATRVQTEYVISADNDDFILLEPLETGLEFLRSRPHVATLGPAQYRFIVHRRIKDVNELVHAGRSRVSVTRLQHRRNAALEDPNPVRRLLEVVENFYSAFIYYGIHRSADYRLINARMRDIGIERAIFFEWYTLYAYAVSGQVVLDRTPPFLLRQEGTSQAASSLYETENHTNVFLLDDWSRQLYAMIGDLFDQSAATVPLDRTEFEENFRRAFRKHMLSFMEFRGLADRFRRFPTFYAWGRLAFAMYRGRHPNVNRREVNGTPCLRRALRFLGDYPGAGDTALRLDDATANAR